MPTKRYRIKKCQRGQLIKLPRAKYAPMHYSNAPIFVQQKCVFQYHPVGRNNLFLQITRCPLSPLNSKLKRTRSRLWKKCFATGVSTLSLGGRGEVVICKNELLLRYSMMLRLRTKNVNEDWNHNDSDSMVPPLYLFEIALLLIGITTIVTHW